MTAMRVDPHEPDLVVATKSLLPPWRPSSALMLDRIVTAFTDPDRRASARLIRTTEGDLVYPEERVWIEVEGDQHRTDRRQWRTDVVRYERLTDLGWRVIRVTAGDVSVRSDETVARVASALRRTSG